MKKICIIIVFLLLSIIFVSCSLNQNENYGAEDIVDILQNIKKDGDYKGQKIDSVLWDIDNDGIDEVCTLYIGLTSGVTSYVITASVDGNIKYKEMFAVSSEAFFDGNSNAPAIVIDGEKYGLYTIDNKIVIEK